MLIYPFTDCHASVHFHYLNMRRRDFYFLSTFIVFPFQFLGYPLGAMQSLPHFTALVLVVVNPT